MRARELYFLVLVLGCLGTVRPACAEEQPYLCELGLQGGVGYYVGDVAPHIFMNPREAYGIHFRYKFTKRWAIQAKVSGQRIMGKDFTNRLYNVDIMGEFNFFRYGDANKLDKRIKPYTPYIFLGVGTGFHQDPVLRNGKETHWSGIYIPLGIGFKWKFHERVGLNIAWQHNIYTNDRLEGSDEETKPGNNWMNCDLTGALTVGIVFEFAKAKWPCRICNR